MKSQSWGLAGAAHLLLCSAHCGSISIFLLVVPSELTCTSHLLFRLLEYIFHHSIGSFSEFFSFFFFSFQSSYEYEEQRHILSFLPFSIRCVTPIILSGTILLPFLHCAYFGSNAFCLLSDDHYEKVRVLRSTDLAYLFTTASPMPRVLSVIW